MTPTGVSVRRNCSKSGCSKDDEKGCYLLGRLLLPILKNKALFAAVQMWVSSYEGLFRSEGKLNEKVTVKAA